MHHRGGDVRRGQRAIAPYEELRAFLVQHIEATERWHKPDADAIDLAEEFLEFVKKRAGLLIEVLTPNGHQPARLTPWAGRG